MKIIVLGSGLLGVSSAYELARRGHEVSVLDRQAESGAETSFANGAQLSYSHAEPWASPTVLPKLAKWIFDPNAPLVFRPRADWHMFVWALRFFRNCTPQRARENCINLLRLGLYSRRKMRELAEQTGLSFDYSQSGILHIFSAVSDFDHAKRQFEFQAKFGCQTRLLSHEECIAREPSLAHSSRPIIGGIHAFQDEIGDAHLFCKNLSELATARHGVQFRYGITIENLRQENNRIVAVQTHHGDFSADAYVMALGSYSSIFLRRAGVHIPVYPMKGYSITITANEHAPKASVTDGSHKIVVTRVGEKVRVAGTAEFCGYDDSVRDKRIAPILAAARQLFPKAAWDHETHRWGCLRPTTPSGLPVLGRTRYENLFLNTGHGTLGWVQAAGSAAIVADIMEQKTPEIMLQGLTL